VIACHGDVMAMPIAPREIAQIHRSHLKNGASVVMS
jgi:hypothetical protein